MQLIVTNRKRRSRAVRKSVAYNHRYDNPVGYYYLLLFIIMKGDDLMICAICNRECEDNRALGIHVRLAHSMSAKDYYDKYIGQPQECITCKKPTKFRSLTAGYSKHCSNRCAQLDPVVAKAREDGCLKRFGYSNALKHPDVKNKVINNRVNNRQQNHGRNHWNGYLVENTER